MTSSKKINWFFIVFAVFVASYAVLIVVSPNLGTSDDYFLLRTLQNGRPLLFYTNPAPGFPIGDFTKFGRFTPLGVAEYNFFNFFSNSPSPFWYYFSHAFRYVVLMILFIIILSKFTSNKFLIYLPPILFSLTQPIPWLRTQMPDGNLIFYYAIFLFFFLQYLEKPKLYYLVLGLIAANIAIYYKENGFIALSVFAFFHLLLSWKKSDSNTDKSSAQQRLKIFEGLVLLSSLVYLILYYFMVYRHLSSNQTLWITPAYNPLLIFVKNIINYGFFNDPILIIILLPFTASRIYKFFRHKLEFHPVYDSMLFAASIFVIGYLVLNIYSPNYLVPAYIFALPPLIYFFSQIKKINPVRSSNGSSDPMSIEYSSYSSARQATEHSASNGVNYFWKTIFIVCGLTLILNVLPTGIHYISYQKYLPLNFNKTLDFLVKDINSRYPDKRANIFIDAINPNGGGGIYFIIGEYLQYKGLAWDRFDLKSEVKVNDNVIQNIPDLQMYAPFSVFRNKFSKISKGDYLIISADGSTQENITQSYIESLNKNYKLIFRTESPLAVPNLNLKILAKYILSSKLSQSQKTQEGLITNGNLFQWPDYYVFIRK